MAFNSLKLFCLYFGVILNCVQIYNCKEQKNERCKNMDIKYKLVAGCYDSTFFQQEGRKLADQFVTDPKKVDVQGYIPVVNGQVMVDSGVLIGDIGIDLGALNQGFLKKAGISNSLINKLKIYLSKKGSEAASILKNTPLELTSEEAKVLADEVLLQIVQNSKKSFKGNFQSLSKAQTTVLVSIFMHSSSCPKHNELAEKAKSSSPDWDSMQSLLQNWCTTDWLYQRRLNEAALLQNDDGKRCCKGKLHGGQCYFHGPDEKSYNEARKYCLEQGGDLAVFANADLIDEVVASGEINELDEPSWIGAVDCSNNLFPTNYFMWVDGQRVEESTFQNLWADKGPATDSHDCAAYSPVLGKIKEYLCDGVKKFLCEVSMQEDEGELVKKIKKKENEKKKSKGSSSPLDRIIKEGKCAKDGIDCDMMFTHLGKTVLTSTNADRSSAIGGGSIPSDKNNKDKKEKEKGKSRKKRNALGVDYRYWLWKLNQPGPYYYVPYLIEKTLFSAGELYNITMAMQSIENRTCVRFISKTEGESKGLYYYAHITRNTGNAGCWSYVARIADIGPTTVHLDSGCTYVGTVQHELMHLLGFWHEHSRPDRDDFIFINFDNIDPNRIGNFEKYSSYILDTQQVSYDYYSIMQYGSYAFALDPNMVTIMSNRPYGVLLGQREMATDNDIAEINLLYQCNMPINGGWAFWSKWSSCSKTCGGGVMMRTRQCNLPIPKNGGSVCVGSTQQTFACSIVRCPDEEISYRWYGCWDDPRLPSRMSSIEGQGRLTDDFRIRGNETVEICAREAKSQGYKIFGLKDRQCYALNNTYAETPEKYIFIDPSEKCLEQKHGAIDAIDVFMLGNNSIKGYYGTWGDYSLCSKSCKPLNGASGIRTRSRLCNNPPPEFPGDIPCDPAGKTEAAECNTVQCPIDGKWSAWTGWSSCSVTCAHGERTRTRQCNDPAPQGGKICEGYITPVDVESENCSIAVNCPVRLDCPAVQTPEAYGNALLYFNLDVGCTENGTVPGSHSLLERFDGSTVATNLTKGRNGNALMIDDDKKYVGVLPGPLKCMHQPGSCPTGFSLSLWIKPSIHENSIKSPQMIFTTGVQADEALSDKEGQGLAIYLRTDNTLKAIVKTADRSWSTDLPSYLITTTKFHHIGVTWSIPNGLKLYYAGIIQDWDKRGNPYEGSYLQIYPKFALGKTCNCNEQTYYGLVDEISLYDNALNSTAVDALYMSVPTDCADCDRNSDCVNNVCTCKQYYIGNGWHCLRDIVVNIANQPQINIGQPLMFWPMDNILLDKSIPQSSNNPGIIDRPLLASKQMTLGLGMHNKALVFDGRSDWVDAGSYKDHCLSEPHLCTNGVTFAFFVNYHGRGVKHNFIFSSGALPWDSFTSTGFSMWIIDDKGYVNVQTLDKLYNVTFQIHHGIWVHYLITWGANGLTVYDNALPIATDPVGLTLSAEPSESTTLVFGKSNQATGLNGRFDMDNLAIFGKSLNKTEAESLFAYGVELVSK